VKEGIARMETIKGHAGEFSAGGTACRKK